MSENNLEAILEKLNKNTMFRLSLSSKELFHSNFWVYLLNQYNAADIFDNDHKGAIKDIKREMSHTDLSYKNEEGLIIIENKFKSTPREEQLKEYVAKNKKEDLKKIILVSYFKPNFTLDSIEGVKVECLSYRHLYDQLKKYINSKDKYLSDYIEMLGLLNELKNILSLKKNSELKYCECLGTIENCKGIAEEMNLYSFIRRIFFMQLGTDLKEQIKNIDWSNCDISRNKKAFLDLMVSCDNKNYTNKGIDSIGITISEGEETIRHHIGIGKSENKNNRSSIENYLKELSTIKGSLLHWFFNDEICTSKKDNGFWGFDCLKDDNNNGNCWLYKKTKNNNFYNYNYEEIKILVQKEITSIINNISLKTGYGT